MKFFTPSVFACGKATLTEPVSLCLLCRHLPHIVRESSLGEGAIKPSSERKFPCQGKCPEGTKGLPLSQKGWQNHKVLTGGVLQGRFMNLPKGLVLRKGLRAIRESPLHRGQIVYGRARRPALTIVTQYVLHGRGSISYRKVWFRGNVAGGWYPPLQDWNKKKEENKTSSGRRVPSNTRREEFCRGGSRTSRKVQFCGKGHGRFVNRPYGMILLTRAIRTPSVSLRSTAPSMMEPFYCRYDSRIALIYNPSESATPTRLPLHKGGILLPQSR